MSKWPSYEENIRSIFASMCCMTRHQKYNLMYEPHWPIKGESTFVEIKRIAHD